MKIMIKGADKIIEESVKAIKNDGFYFVGITGEKGNGKSTLAWHLVREIIKQVGHDLDFIKDKDVLLSHVIFTIDDFFNIKNRDKVIKWDDGRVCVALWDDFGLHTSSYAFIKGEGDKVADFVEMFEVVRENIAVLIVTAATFDLVPPKIRNSPNIIIDCYKRGEAKIYGKKRLLWVELLWKQLKKEITFDKIPKEFYNEYRKIKAKAIEVKKMMRVVKLEDKAQKLAERLTEQDWQNESLLIAYGIKDMFGNFTPFGELVKKYYKGVVISSRSRSPKRKITYKEFIKLYRSFGLRGTDERLNKFYNKLMEIIYGNGKPEIPQEIPADELFS